MNTSGSVVGWRLLAQGRVSAVVVVAKELTIGEPYPPTDALMR
jgi:hypothetical protein